LREALKKNKLRTIYDRVAGRYDFQHSFLTARSDQRGRQLVVARAVKQGERVLDAGAGTGSTGLLAAQKTGPSGKVVLFDLSEGMLKVARKRATNAGVAKWIEFETGDLTSLPFADNSFDVALSTYSICPLYDPEKGAMEMFRVIRPGGLIGIAHSTDPERGWLKWLAQKVEDIVWHFPGISLGCRSVSVLPTLEKAGGKLIFKRQIGIPLWPFLVIVIEKPAEQR
jgi:demethylmenaquinone methyltransferase/2-methoxy-6-polyprenyl-1,4-benzoquinol methylase